MRATYLTGERIHLRAMTLSDKDHAPAWIGGPFPIDADRAETILKDAHKDLSARRRYLAIVLNDTDELVGCVNLLTNGRIADIWFNVAPWRDDRDSIQADALRLVVPWLRDEATMATTDVVFAEDHVLTAAAAEDMNMRLSVRLREHMARPGHRVDLLTYQALGPAWTYPEETGDA